MFLISFTELDKFALLKLTRGAVRSQRRTSSWHYFEHLVLGS